MSASDYSPRKVWLHPRKSARWLRELAAENESLLTSVADAEEAVREKEAQVRAISVENDALKSKLKNYTDTARRLQEIDESLKKVEQLKARYEKRIKDLKKRISFLEQNSMASNPSGSPSMSEYDELFEIDMQSPLPAEKQAKEDPQNDWLEDLPD